MPKEYRLFYTTSKLPVWVGKNAKMNDAMTFTLAHKDDVWFHVKDIPGPHVILHCEENPITQQDIQEVIQIVRQSHKDCPTRQSHKDCPTRRYSKSKLPIIYTRVINVEKPTYSKAGLVVLSSYESITPPPSGGRSTAEKSSAS